VRGVVGWATLTSRSATEADLASWDGPGRDKLVGIRNNHGWAPDGDILRSAQALDSCRLLAELRLPLDLHFPDYTDLPLALKLVEQVPGGIYVIDHLGKPLLNAPETFERWAASMAILSECPNIYVKYSGWATFVGRAVASDIRRHIHFILDKFTADRVMFASNWPVALVAATYEQTYKATLEAISECSASELEAILHGTADRVYLAPRR
jgi:L-fuconolactonase